MSVLLMGQVWSLKLPANEQIVLLAMADHADHTGGNIFPSNGLIAWKVGASPRTVIRIKQRLMDKGILVLVSQRVGGVKTYRIDITKGQQKPPYNREQDGPTPDKALSPPTPDNLSPPLGQGSDTPPGHSSDTPPRTRLCHPNHQLTTKEPPIKETTPSTRPEPRTRKVLELHPDTQATLETWGARFKDHFGHKYVRRAKDDRHLSALLSAGIGKDELIRIAILAWQQIPTNPTFIVKQAVSLQGLAERWNEIRLAVEPRKPKTNSTEIRNRYDEQASFTSRL